ncbi:MAG: replication initiation protein [Tannerella sp.]|jgi:hypothetical protein|nr:replication initiation protein [Tannerella sp.]
MGKNRGKKKDITTALKILHTEKRKVQVLVPELAEYIIQPNAVTNAVYEYNLLEERILTGLMYQLQTPIHELKKLADVKQLSLFNDPTRESEDTVKMLIPLKDITTAPNYARVEDAAKKMRQTNVVFPIERDGLPFTVVGGLIDEATIPLVNNRRSSHLEIRMSKKVAEILINIRKKGDIPVEYTRYVYQIAQNASSKYTSLLYKKIASWKVKGGFTIPLEDLYRDICVQKVYLNKDGSINYKNFKSNVLEKAKNELYQKADCWFEYTENYEGRRVKSITFKVITPEMEQTREDKIFYLKKLMIVHLQVYEKDIPAGLFEKVDLPTIGAAILRIKEAIDTVRPVNKKGYAIKSLQNLMINDK